METASGTLMHGIFALASLPIAVALMIFGLAAETRPGSVTHERYRKEGETVRLPRAA